MRGVLAGASTATHNCRGTLPVWATPVSHVVWLLRVVARTLPLPSSYMCSTQLMRSPSWATGSLNSLSSSPDFMFIALAYSWNIAHMLSVLPIEFPSVP